MESYTSKGDMPCICYQGSVDLIVVYELSPLSELKPWRDCSCRMRKRLRQRSGGTGGVLILLLASVTWTSTTYPFRDGAPFFLRRETPPTFGHSVLLFHAFHYFVVVILFPNLALFDRGRAGAPYFFCTSCSRERCCTSIINALKKMLSRAEQANAMAAVGIAQAEKAKKLKIGNERGG